MTTATLESSHAGRRVAAVFAGLLAIFVLSLGTDAVLHGTGVYPEWGRPMTERLFVLASAYRVVYDVFGCWSMETCEIDPRIGGASRFVWTGPDGGRMGYRALCTEISPPERIATTARFDEPWFEGEERGTVTFEELGSRTLLTVWLRYESTKVRDEVLASPMAQGMALSFDKLEEHLAAPADNWMDAEAGVP